MKVRQGFVGNSSSASFIIKWKYLGDKTELKEIIPDVLDIWDFKEDPIILADVNHLIKDTTARKNNVYVTELFTCMYNSILDFPRTEYLLLAATAHKDKMRIISTKIESDND